MDWADERSKEWLETVEIDDEPSIASLAALLREVIPTPAEEQEYKDRERVRVLAEVRRVVEECTVLRLEFTGERPIQDDLKRLASEILSRLEALK